MPPCCRKLRRGTRFYGDQRWAFSYRLPGTNGGWLFAYPPMFLRPLIPGPTAPKIPNLARRIQSSASLSAYQYGNRSGG
jgi:hypothetical protein